MHALVGRCTRELLRRDANALVHDLEAGVAGAKSDLLGSVRVPVEPRLADENLRTPSEGRLQSLHLAPECFERSRIAGFEIQMCSGRGGSDLEHRRFEFA